jgi:hypothetical protein
VKRSSESGSSPLELVVYSALLTLPIGLSIGLFQQLSNELAAESISRHALRLAMLNDPLRPSSEFESTVSIFASNWGVKEVDYRFWCSSGCSLVTLEVRVGSASAIQTMGLPKT